MGSFSVFDGSGLIPPFLHFKDQYFLSACTSSRKSFSLEIVCSGQKLWGCEAEGISRRGWKEKAAADGDPRNIVTTDLRASLKWPVWVLVCLGRFGS